MKLLGKMIQTETERGGLTLMKDEKFFEHNNMFADDAFFSDKLEMDDLDGVSGGVDVISGKKTPANSRNAARLSVRDKTVGAGSRAVRSAGDKKD